MHNVEERVDIDGIKIECFLVPGHTWGHMVYLIDDEYLFMKAIIGKYAKSDHADDDYIFPILDRRIHKTEQQIYDRVRKVLKHVNKALHEWSRLLGLKVELTTYVARHTFATVLKRSGVNIAIISESLGHSDLSTTQIYLDSFENSQIDAAMQNLL